MTDEVNTPTGGGEAVAANTAPPRNDAEAAQQEATNQQQAGDAEKAAKAEAEKADEGKRNRTREYIQRINGENADMRRRLAELERAQSSTPNTPQRQSQGAPTLEQYNYDFTAWNEANREYLIDQAKQGWTKEQKQAETQRQQQETIQRYEQRAAEFADDHPDFVEVVGSIDPQFLTVEVQAAIMGHEMGPQIAYHLANHEDDLWQLASIRADLMPAAVARLASRLGAAPPAPVQASAPTPQPKPITQAPPPPPTVAGRSPSETPAEKLTDDEWYRRDRDKRRKR